MVKSLIVDNYTLLSDLIKIFKKDVVNKIYVNIWLLSVKLQVLKLYQKTNLLPKKNLFPSVLKNSDRIFEKT